MEPIPSRPQVHIGESKQLEGEGPRCPMCGSLLDGVTQVDFANGDADKLPQPGDFTVSACCATLLRYQKTPAGFGLRILTDADLAEMPCELMTQLATLRRVMKAYGAKKKAEKK